jgi:hypothetical protein
MKAQSLQASGGLSLFTSLYSFNRVALVDDHNQLFVTKNIAIPPHLDKENRGDPQASKHFLNLLFIFLIAAISWAYPEAIPPKRRENYSHIFNPWCC